MSSSEVPGQPRKELDNVSLGGGLFAKPADPEQTVPIKRLEFELLCRGSNVSHDESFWVFCLSAVITGILAIVGLLCSSNLSDPTGKANWWALGSLIAYLVLTVAAFAIGAVCFLRSRSGKKDPIYNLVRDRIERTFESSDPASSKK